MVRSMTVRPTLPKRRFLRQRARSVLPRVALLVLGGAVATRMAAQTLPSWPPSTAADFGSLGKSGDPSAPAVLFYYDVRTDDTNSTETYFKRIRILREEGKKYADIEIPYFDKRMQVEDIHARTV